MKKILQKLEQKFLTCFKAELYLMHAIELSESAFSIYNPAIIIRDITEIERIANDQLTRLAEKLKKEYAIKVNTTCITGKLVTEVATFIKKKKRRANRSYLYGHTISFMLAK